MIHVLTTFNDGYTRYYAGEVVSAKNFQPADLQKFIEYGWAKEEGAESAPAAQGVSATLEIHNGPMGHSSKVN